MSEAFSITFSGIRELQDAISAFARIARADNPDGYMEGVRLTAAFVAQSLAKRTPKQSAKKAHPYFREATKSDFFSVGAITGMTAEDVNKAWHAVNNPGNGGVPGAYVGDRGFSRGGSSLKPRFWVSKTKEENHNVHRVTIPGLNKQYRYLYSGLANYSWLTQAQKTKRSAVDRHYNSAIDDALRRLAVVWVSPSELHITFHNKLSYITDAMKQGAIADALTAGMRRFEKYAEAQCNIALRKAGLDGVHLARTKAVAR